MASALSRLALSAASRSRAATIAMLAAPLGASAAPSPSRALATTAPRVGGLLPHRPASSPSSPAPVKVRAAALGTNTGDDAAAAEEGTGNGSKAEESGQGAAREGAAVDVCRCDEITAHLKLYVREQMNKDAAAKVQLLVNLFEEEREDRHKQGRYESNRQMLFGVVLLLLQMWISLKKDAARGAVKGAGSSREEEEAQEQEQKGGRAVGEAFGVAAGVEEAKHTGAEEKNKVGRAVEEAKDSKAGLEEAKSSNADEIKVGNASTGLEQEKGGAMAGSTTTSATAAAVEGKGAAAANSSSGADEVSKDGVV